MRILLAIDGSEPSEAAIRAIHQRPWPDGTTVRVLSVVEFIYPVSPEAALLAEFERSTQALVEETERRVAHAAGAIRGSGHTVEESVRRGDPRTEIVEEARSFRADLIVIGSHGRTGIGRWLIGSVAESVVRHAPCSVEVARPRAAPR